VAVVADFGRAPSNVLMCSAYAWRVFRRKRELRRMLQQAQAAAAAAERERDDLLATLAEHARPQLQDDREMAGFQRLLAQAEQVAQERETALSARSADYASAVSAVDEKIAAEEAIAAEANQRVEQASGTFTQRSQELSRAQALLKRAEIELRNRQQLARAAAGPDSRVAPPEHAAAILEAQEGAAQRKLEIAAPQAQLDAAQHVLREAERAAGDVNRRISVLRSQRRAIEQTFGREMGLRTEGLEQAQTDRRAALIGLGARLMDVNSPCVADADREAFDLARKTLSTRCIEVERIMRAIASADPVAVKKGWLVIGGAALLAFVLLVILVATLGHSV
jgi:hypothetical protein